ncbi:hypothetical protein VW23_025620 [Devosia insulae DS-56]|uniref:Uncharacterized protein n=1 Tax=Devosia insulae DS-56 TaxID=1116389 RepID=A0A1E5XLF2_9HYPH|nr:hypothetical protein [Devosia insulae]OEO29402.1 hypothetical protein VW23_025620 [Devosia insulae DS-56]
MLRLVARSLIFVLLTLATQIGGLAYLAALGLARLLRVRHQALRLGLFLLCYGAASISAMLAVPSLGRVPLPCFAGNQQALAAQSPLYCVLNRNYVTPELREAAQALAEHVDTEFPGTTTLALDGGFPFLDGFPLLPHLSHGNGLALDVAYYYEDAESRFRNGVTRSPIGYFAFEQPAASDVHPCLAQQNGLSLRWDFDALQPLFPNYRLERQRTGAALRWLATAGVTRFGVRSVFIEPHLKQSLGVNSSHIRFQGCRAARHDDHLHIQLGRSGGV